MASPSLLQQARAGDEAAMAAWLGQFLQPQAIALEVERHSYCLQLRLSAKTLPPQATLVASLRRAVERLQIDAIGILQIQAESTEAPGDTWQVELSLLTSAEGDGNGDANDPAIPPSQSSQVDQGNPPLVRGKEAGPATVARAYQTLNLPPEAALAAVESAYWQARAEQLGRGDRAGLERLQRAYQILQDYWQGSQATPPETSGRESFPAPTAPAAELSGPFQALLRSRGLPAQVSQRGTELHIQWPMVRVANPQQATAQIHRLLNQPGQQGTEALRTLVCSGLNRHNQVVWQKRLPLSRPASPADQSDLLRSRATYREALGFGLVLVLGMLMNAIPLVNFLLQGIKIWFHELGHATMAWLAGRQALPLPIGWTSLNPQRSLLVYLGVLTLLGLLYWTGRRLRLRWPMGLAIGLAGLQFAMTWFLAPDTFAMLFAFGGLGGEFYLSTLLLVSFFSALPQGWRWEFYRYPLGLGAAFTFWGQFWLWKRVRYGHGSIPFGSLWGEPSQGDMNLLIDPHGWTPGAIIQTYDGLGNLCVLLILGVYGYHCLKPYRPWRLALGQRWLAEIFREP